MKMHTLFGQLLSFTKYLLSRSEKRSKGHQGNKTKKKTGSKVAGDPLVGHQEIEDKGGEEKETEEAVEVLIQTEGDKAEKQKDDNNADVVYELLK